MQPLLLSSRLARRVCTSNDLSAEMLDAKRCWGRHDLRLVSKAGESENAEFVDGKKQWHLPAQGIGLALRAHCGTRLVDEGQLGAFLVG